MRSQSATATQPSLEAVITRVRGEYLEMPGLRLTMTQFCRLFGVSPLTSREVVAALLEDHFLRRTDDGALARVEAPW